MRAAFDIAFSSDSAGLTLIPFELVNYNAENGAIEFWVSVATLSHTTDTVIYMQYGGTSITDHSNKAGVWASAYKAVYHLGDGTTLNLSDSSQSGNSLTNVGGTAVAGQVGGAIDFSATYAHNTSTTGLPTGSSTPVLVECWFKLANNGAQEFLGFGDNSGSGKRAAIFYQGGNVLSLEWGTTSNTVSWTYDTNWHHVALHPRRVNER